MAGKYSKEAQFTFNYMCMPHPLCVCKEAVLSFYEAKFLYYSIESGRKKINIISETIREILKCLHL